MASRKDLAVFKFGQPLFAAAWPHGDTLLVAGGGGKPGSGIENRIIAAKYANGELSDEVGCVRLKGACEKLACAPSGRFVLAVTSRGLLGYQLEASTGALKFVMPQTAIVKALASDALQHVCALRFAPDGAIVACGTKSGAVVICHGRTMHALAELDTAALASGSVEAKDVAISRSREGYTVAMAVESGDCYLWTLSGQPEQGRSMQLRRANVLFRPRIFSNHIIKHCRGRGSLARWHFGAGASGRLRAQSAVLASPVTGLDVSPHGEALGICTSEGETLTLDARTLRVRSRNRKAHMVFGTEVAFAADGHAMVSVSADASARVTCVATGAKPLGAAGGLAYILLLLFFLVLGAAAAVLLHGGWGADASIDAVRSDLTAVLAQLQAAISARGGLLG